MLTADWVRPTSSAARVKAAGVDDGDEGTEKVDVEVGYHYQSRLSQNLI